MKVYHRSYSAIEHNDFSFCRKRRDFGKGFYVTKIFLQTEYWAMKKCDDNDTECVVTKFKFDEDFFEDDDLHVLRFDGYSENHCYRNLCPSGRRFNGGILRQGKREEFVRQAPFMKRKL